MQTVINFISFVLVALSIWLTLAHAFGNEAISSIRSLPVDVNEMCPCTCDVAPFRRPISQCSVSEAYASCQLTPCELSKSTSSQKLQHLFKRFSHSHRGGSTRGIACCPTVQIPNLNRQSQILNKFQSTIHVSALYAAMFHNGQFITTIYGGGLHVFRGLLQTGDVISVIVRGGAFLSIVERDEMSTSRFMTGVHDWRISRPFGEGREYDLWMTPKFDACDWSTANAVDLVESDLEWWKFEWRQSESVFSRFPYRDSASDVWLQGVPPENELFFRLEINSTSCPR